MYLLQRRDLLLWGKWPVWRKLNGAAPKELNKAVSEEPNGAANKELNRAARQLVEGESFPLGPCNENYPHREVFSNDTPTPVRLSNAWLRDRFPRKTLGKLGLCVSLTFNPVTNRMYYSVKVGGEIITEVPSDCLEFILRTEDSVVHAHMDTADDVNGDLLEVEDSDCLEYGGNSSEALSSSDDEMSTPPL